MKHFFVAFPLVCLPLLAQVAAPPETPAPKPETVIATIDGKKLTYGEIEAYLDGIGPDRKRAALMNRMQFIQEYALFLRLLDFAGKEKLQEQSPYKEALAANRMQIMVNAAMDYEYQHVIVTVDDQKKFYDDNHDRFTQVKLQVLYLGFVADPAAAAKETPGKKYRTQEEARTQIEALAKQIKSREDFIRMVKEYSEDEASKAKDGEFGTFKKSDNLPDDVKQVVFSLKEGEISGPILQRNGFYLFRAETVGLRPYGEVKDDIYNELKDLRVRKWVEEKKNTPIQIEDKAFFANQPISK